MIIGNEIRFKGRRDSWTTEQVEQFMRRVAHIVSDGTLEIQDQGYTFMLGYSNDWWGKYDEESREVVVAYRYGTGHPELLAALETVIAHFAGVKP